MVYERPLRSDELMHFGVPGMKWGVRKRRENINKFYQRHPRMNSYRTQYDVMRDNGMSRKEIKARKKADKKTGKYSVNTSVAKGRRSLAVLGASGAAMGAGLALSKGAAKGSRASKVGSALLGAGVLGTAAGVVGLANTGHHALKAGRYLTKKKKRK